MGGFGHSGSGALLDALTELDNVTDIGYHDVNDGSQVKENNFIEFDNSVFLIWRLHLKSQIEIQEILNLKILSEQQA